MDQRIAAALIALLSMFTGWVVGREHSYGPLADRLMVCEQGLWSCADGLARCGSGLSMYEEWAREARDRRLLGKTYPPMGPIERRAVIAAPATAQGKHQAPSR